MATKVIKSNGFNRFFIALMACLSGRQGCYVINPGATPEIAASQRSTPAGVELNRRSAGTGLSTNEIRHLKIKHQTSNFMLVATNVSTATELKQILLLQQQNLRGVHTEAAEKEQGFVTVAHTPELLRKMHALEPSIIVKDNDTLAGYALVMLKECSNLVPELVPMFEGLNKIIYRGKPLSDYKLYVMGQICVAAAYRGRGVFDMLYQQHRLLLQHKYDFVITEIATRNTRSIRAHQRVGFEILQVHRDELDEWAVVIWDWRNTI